MRMDFLTEKNRERLVQAVLFDLIDFAFEADNFDITSTKEVGAVAFYSLFDRKQGVPSCAISFERIDGKYCVLFSNISSTAVGKGATGIVLHPPEQITIEADSIQTALLHVLYACKLNSKFGSNISRKMKVAFTKILLESVDWSCLR